LQQGRIQEAEQLLLQTLSTDPKSAFTLNNLGYTMEAEGNLEAAARYYQQAADLRSSDKIVVALDARWRGKPISEVAAENARAVGNRLETEQSAQARAARMNLQGVFALNHNDPQKARDNFESAYKLDPYSPFSLNNMGYVSELNGDQETADEFYGDAKLAPGAKQRVTVANHPEMQGMPLGEVAANNSQNTEANLQVQQDAKRRQGGAIELKTRDNRPIVADPDPSTPDSTQPTQAPDTSLRQVPRPPEGQFPPNSNDVPKPPQ
jgi:Flp pilus assembly protein TadD